MVSLTASAQTLASTWETVRAVVAGTEVRIATGNSTRIEGKLESVTDSALVITQPTGRRSLPRIEIHSVSVKKKGHRVRNALIGFGVGVGAGIVIGVFGAQNCNEQGQLCGAAGAAAVAAGIAAGTGIGLVWPTGGWREIYAQ